MTEQEKTTFESYLAQASEYDKNVTSKVPASVHDQTEDWELYAYADLVFSELRTVDSMIEALLGLRAIWQEALGNAGYFVDTLDDSVTDFEGSVDDPS